MKAHTLFPLVVALFVQSCASRHTTSVYISPPLTEPVSDPSVEMVTGSYAYDGDMICGLNTLTLRGDFTYRREEEFVSDLDMPNDPAPISWINVEQGTWTLEGSHISLSPQVKSVQNSYAQTNDFDKFTSFETRMYKNRRALRADKSFFRIYQKSTEEPNQSAHPPLAQSQRG